MSDRPAWFEDVEEEAPRGRRRRLLPALAGVAVLWLAVSLVLLGRGAPEDEPAEPLTHQLETDEGHPGGPPTAAPPSEGAGARTEGTVGADPTGAEDPSLEDTTSTPQPGADIGHDEAAAVVTAVVRGWLSDGGPDLAIAGLEVDRRAYLEHLSVERFDLPGPDLAVARTLLVLLLRDGDHYTEAVLRRAAVPIALTEDGPLPAGRPWWLPDDPELAVVTPATDPLDDPALTLEVIEALEAAGYRDVAVTEVAGTATGALVAEIDATTPSDGTVAGPVWLLASEDGPLVLAGAAPPPAVTTDQPGG